MYLVIFSLLLQWFSLHSLDYPKDVQKIVDQKTKSCKENGKGQLTISSRAIQALNINEDKISDYLVDESGFSCTTENDMHAGSLATKIQVFLSDKSAYKLALSTQVLAYQWKPSLSQLEVEIYSEKDSTLLIKKIYKAQGAKLAPTSAPSP